MNIKYQWRILCLHFFSPSSQEEFKSGKIPPNVRLFHFTSIFFHPYHDLFDIFLQINSLFGTINTYKASCTMRGTEQPTAQSAFWANSDN